MLDKVKTFLTILLILIIIFAVGYSVVKVVISLFKEPNIITSENINNYIKDENIVLDYSTYYYLNDCLNNFIEACNQQKYNELYQLYDEDYLKQYTEEEVIVKLTNLQWKTEQMDEFIEYKLEKIYKTENSYLLEITLENKKMYFVFSIGNSKNYDYNWAFVK